MSLRKRDDPGRRDEGEAAQKAKSGGHSAGRGYDAARGRRQGMPVGEQGWWSTAENISDKLLRYIEAQ